MSFKLLLQKQTNSTIENVTLVLAKHIIKTSEWVFPCLLPFAQEVHLPLINKKQGTLRECKQKSIAEKGTSISHLFQSPSCDADKVNADITEGGRGDWGYTHECKTNVLRTWLVEFTSDEVIFCLEQTDGAYCDKLLIDPQLTNLWNLMKHTQDHVSI